MLEKIKSPLSQKLNQLAPRVKVIFVILGGIAVIYLTLKVIFISIPYFNRYDPCYVARNFAQALRQNNSSLAKRLTLPSRWEQIDEWMNSHEPLECPLSRGFDEKISTSGCQASEESARFSYYEQCYIKNRFYYDFNVDEIILKKQDGLWQVEDWKYDQEK